MRYYYRIRDFVQLLSVLYIYHERRNVVRPTDLYCSSSSHLHFVNC